MKILILVPYPSLGPSTRYRVEQYLPYLRKNNIDCKISPFISEEFYKITYDKGFYAKKIFCLFDSFKKRLLDILTFFNYDLIFIHLEAFPIGPPLLEYVFSIFKKTIIFDLDDAIYLERRIFANKIIKILKYPQKVPTIIKLSTHIIVCNSFLKDYVSRFKNQENITVIHTPIDTDKFFPLTSRPSDNKNLVIGWIGSHTTAIYLYQLKSVFQKLAAKYDFVLKIIGSGEKIDFPGLNVINEKWSLERDVENFQSLDIGIYPLSNDEWVLGKTGFKTIQYMSVGVPCVASDVGSNKEIINDGVNGFLAKTEEDWIEKISRLIEDRALRQRMGLAGRKTVEAQYSVKMNAPKFLEVIRKAYKGAYKI